MATYVSNCPRCGAQEITFDIAGDILVRRNYDWQSVFEVFAKCRRCLYPSIFELVLRDPNRAFSVSGSVSQQDFDLTPLFILGRVIDISVTQSKPIPHALPDAIAAAFAEGAKCLAVKCPNAASAMFRLCLDLATKERLPKEGAEGAPNPHQRRNLAPRLEWLFANGGLPTDLKDLSAAVKGNGDEGAHEGSLSEAEAEDIYDFAFHLLERLYSQPARLAAAREAREARKREH